MGDKAMIINIAFNIFAITKKVQYYTTYMIYIWCHTMSSGLELNPFFIRQQTILVDVVDATNKFANNLPTKRYRRTVKAV